MSVDQPVLPVSVAANDGLPVKSQPLISLLFPYTTLFRSPVIAVPANENVWFGCVLETTTFLVISFAFSVFVNVQVIVSPGSGRNVAVSVAAADRLLCPWTPVHELSVDQPVLVVSVETKLGLPVKSEIVFWLVSLLPSDTGPPVIAVPSNENVSFGWVLETTSFLVISFAFSVFVNVQVIVSPGSGRNVAVRPVSEDRLL